MRKSSQVLIFVNLEKAMKAGIKFVLSANGVVLTSGDEKGYLSPSFFKRVETRDHTPIRGWEGQGHIEHAEQLVEGDKLIGTDEIVTSVGEDRRSGDTSSTS